MSSPSLLTLMLLVILSSGINCQLFTTQNTSPPVKNVFLLAGQSNMAGRGGVNVSVWDGVVPPQCQPDPQILRLNAALVWEEAKEPLHREIDTTKTCGIGPGMPFSNYILESDSSMGEIGLVPCAVGGTNISQWKRDGILYNQLVSRADAALQGSGGILRAILWYQGESDSFNETIATQYQKKLEDFITNLRDDLRSPLLPFIQVALASGGNSTDTVREAQFNTCTCLPNVTCVDAKGLPLNSDNLHLTTSSQVQLGKMLADAFLETTKLK